MLHAISTQNGFAYAEGGPCPLRAPGATASTHLPGWRGSSLCACACGSTRVLCAGLAPCAGVIPTPVWLSHPFRVCLLCGSATHITILNQHPSNSPQDPIVFPPTLCSDINKEEGEGAGFAPLCMCIFSFVSVYQV
jgi:hypothetical protein